MRLRYIYVPVIVVIVAIVMLWPRHRPDAVNHEVVLDEAARSHLAPGGKASPPSPSRPSPSSPLPTPVPAPLPARHAPLQNFPWQPPRPSESMDLPQGAFYAGLGKHPSLGLVASRLLSALNTAGYPEYKFYAVPHGFALVTRIEQFEPDGRPGPQADRFTYPDIDQPFSLTDYVEQLYVAPEGRYRLIVFVVTDVDVQPDKPAPSVTEARRWLDNGANRLPSEYDAMPFTPGHHVTALIYEFRKHGSDAIVTLQPGRLDARTHLVQTGLYNVLVGGGPG